MYCRVNAGKQSIYTYIYIIYNYISIDIWSLRWHAPLPLQGSSRRGSRCSKKERTTTCHESPKGAIRRVQRKNTR